MKRNFKQWWSTIPQISAKGPRIIKHTNTKTYSDGNPGFGIDNFCITYLPLHEYDVDLNVEY